MTIHVLVTRSRPRWLTVVVAGTLATWLLSPIDFEATETPGFVAQSAGPADSFGGSPMILYTPARAVAPGDSIAEQTPPQPRITPLARSLSPPTPALPELPYRFLGKVTDAGETVVVLYGRGRTVTVRATGPLDDDYAVDAIEDGYLMLRYVPLGASQTLELASRQPTVVPAGSATETPDD